jgi:uncharacterized membrane protein
MACSKMALGLYHPKIRAIIIKRRREWQTEKVKKVEDKICKALNDLTRLLIFLLFFIKFQFINEQKIDYPYLLLCTIRQGRSRHTQSIHHKHQKRRAKIKAHSLKFSS